MKPRKFDIIAYKEEGQVYASVGVRCGYKERNQVFYRCNSSDLTSLIQQAQQAQRKMTSLGLRGTDRPR